MSMFRKAMDYLGLGNDESYDYYDDQNLEDQEFDPRQRGPQRNNPRQPQRRIENNRNNDFSDTYDDQSVSAGMRRQQEQSDSGLTLRPTMGNRQDASVRPLPISSEPVTVYPETYEDAIEIVDHFKRGAPVIIDVRETEPKIMRRVVDFASGVAMFAGGSIEKTSTGVFTMKPPLGRVTRG